MSFDVEHLIELIREIPFLWDQNSDEYSNKTTKQQCWQEVFCEMKDNLNSSLSLSSKIDRIDIPK